MSPKLALKILVVSFLSSFLVFYLLALSGLSYPIIYIPGVFWLAAMVVPEGGPAVLGAAVWIVSFVISLIAVGWILFRREKKLAAK